MSLDLVPQSEQLYTSTACIVNHLHIMTPDLALHRKPHIIRSLALSTECCVALSTIYYVAVSTMYILASSHQNSRGFRFKTLQQQHGLCLAGTSCSTYVCIMTHAGPAEKVEAAD